jgi:membrane carboxypeptidase/penicillin-binding protein
MSKEQIHALLQRHQPGRRPLRLWAAARHYSARRWRTSRAEAADLAGHPAAPGELSPYRKPGRSVSRRNIILSACCAKA